MDELSDDGIFMHIHEMSSCFFGRKFFPASLAPSATINVTPLVAKLIAAHRYEEKKGTGDVMIPP
jgi:hypothetical protein